MSLPEWLLRSYRLLGNDEISDLQAEALPLATDLARLQAQSLKMQGFIRQQTYSPENEKRDSKNRPSCGRSGRTTTRSSRP